MTNGPSEVPTTSQFWKKALLGFLAVFLTLVFAGWNLSSWPARLRYPGEIAFIEGMRVAEMVHLRIGVAIYGPLCYLLGSQLANPELAAEENSLVRLPSVP